MVKKRRRRVIVAMSSGVDSSVAAALLKKQGCDVIGVFMHFWKEGGQDTLRENKCCSLESQQDARKVAQMLEIPLYTINAAKEFKKEIVDYFIEENKSGRTPNPCVVCNERIKFNFLFRKMLEMKADFVASGHYAEIKKIKNKFHLYKPKDEDKDQTYFLYNLTQKQLKHILFPVGKFKKMEVRNIAKKMGLPVFNKDDSQGLCFTPEKYPTEFLRRHLKLKKGKTINVDGKVLGTHEGLPLYTIGQRRGINIGGTGPYYVVEKNIKKNILIVTNDENHPLLYQKSLLAEKVRWIVKEPKLSIKVLTKIRYRHPLVPALIRKSEKNEANDYLVEFINPQKAVTPGQSAVFYSSSGEVLGGGLIK